MYAISLIVENWRREKFSGYPVEIFVGFTELLGSKMKKGESETGDRVRFPGLMGVLTGVFDDALSDIAPPSGRNR